MQWGVKLLTVWKRWINLGDQSLSLQCKRHSLSHWHVKDVGASRQCHTSASETSVQAGDTARNRAWSSVPDREHLGAFISIYTQHSAAAPACSDHAAAMQNRGLDYFNVIPAQVHRQNIQPEASTVCCSWQTAHWEQFTSLSPFLWLVLNSQIELRVVITYIAITALRPFKLIKPSLSPYQMLMLSLREPVSTWCVRLLVLLSFHASYQFSSFSTATLSSSGSIHRYTPYLACDL